MAMTKVKNLQIWCKKMADGYRDVEVRDMAASWKSGLAFCAIIHRFRPDLIDYDSLSKENIFDNNQLAFEVAEKQLNIPAFLEAADMVAIRVPDKLSIVTYVSQYYNYFHNKPQLGGPGVNKFNQSGKKKDTSQPVSKNLAPIKVNDGESRPQKERQESIGDKCTICHEKVYLLERHIENCKLYHRSCFRKSDLSPTSKVFKRHPQSTAEEDKNDFLSNKHRKIDPAGDKTRNGTEDSGLDFWQRRAQQKTKQADSRKPEPMETAEKNDTTVTSSSVASDTPSWKKDLEMRNKDKASNKPVEIKVNNDFNVNSNTVASDIPSGKKNNNKTGAGLGTPFQQSSEMTPEPKKSMGLADRFKKLDQQNLKNLGHGKDDLSTDKQHGKTNFNETKPEREIKDKGLGKSAEVPKAKPRQTVTNKFEEMETEPSDPVVPKPVPRFQKNETDLKSPRAAPRKIDSKTKSPPLSKKKDFSRPKTPPQSHKPELSLNLPKNKEKSAKDESPSSPPPLPSSSPPKLPTSQPPQLPSSIPPRTDTSALLSAKSKQSASKDISSAKPATNFQTPPSKPPRASVDVDRLITGHGNESPAKSENRSRSVSPMAISGKQEAPKVVIKESQVEHTAVLVTPNRQEDEKKNRAVFGGLLKSLAGVRKNYEANSDSKVELNGTPSNVNSIETNVVLNGAKQNEGGSLTTKNEKHGKDNDISKTDTKETSLGQRRPKSSFVSLTSNVFDNEPKESHVKVDITKKTTTTTTVVTFNKGDKAKDIKTEVVTTVMQEEDTVAIPEWKKQLEQRKNEKARPKSADILNEKSDMEDIPLWKIEAERRKEARKGGYVDPEKAKVDQNLNAKSSQLPSSQDDQTFNLTRPLSPHRKTSQDTSDTFVPAKLGQNLDTDKSKSPERRKIPFKDEKLRETSTPSEVSKKKITVDYKFKFEEVGQKKPPRPNVPPSPKSPKEQKSGPYRPPPPKGTEFQPTKHHISAYQIQKNLQLIDTKLTELEIKGRTLEDSIRKATDEEEDDLMIEWFGLVNQKNELVRTECDYIYVSRQQELEVEQHQIDQQLRYLVDKEDKTDEDLREEEYLMEKLVDVVNQRSKIVDSIDEDRLRYIEEDTLIEQMLQQKGYSKDSKNMIKKDKKKAR